MILKTLISMLGCVWLGLELNKGISWARFEYPCPIVIFRMVKDQKSPSKTDRADQTVSHGDLTLGEMVILTPPTAWPRLAPTRFARELAKCWGISKKKCNLLLQTSFFAQSEPNQHRKILWRVNINNYQKSLTFDSPSQRSAKTFKRGRATFSKRLTTPKRNDISLPNSEHLYKSSIWDHRGNILDFGHLLAL